MRTIERVWMVQTEQQYICIHQCLLAVLDGKENISSSPREIHDNQGYEGKRLDFITFIHLFWQCFLYSEQRLNDLLKVFQTFLWLSSIAFTFSDHVILC